LQTFHYLRSGRNDRKARRGKMDRTDGRGRKRIRRRSGVDGRRDQRHRSQALAGNRESEARTRQDRPTDLA